MDLCTQSQLMVAIVNIVSCLQNVCKMWPHCSKPLTNFKKATEKLDKHFFENQFHKSAVVAAMMFSKVQQNKALAIDQQLNTLRRERIAENHVKLRSILETIIFLWKTRDCTKGTL